MSPSPTATRPTFFQKLEAAQERNKSLLCVGLDPVPARFPASVGQTPESIAAFNRTIVEATRDLVCCYKPNLGFYLRYGTLGWQLLEQLRADIPADIPVLLDAKFGDMDITSVGYAAATFDTLDFDAVTVNPYLGHDSLMPFLERADRGVIILAKTSNPDSGMLQDQMIEGGKTVTEVVVRNAQQWNVNNNVGLVVGATYPEELAAIRAMAPELTFLIPGVGAQGGDVEQAVRNGINADGRGIIVSTSRSICYASDGDDFGEAARAAAESLRAQMEQARG